MYEQTGATFFPNGGKTQRRFMVLNMPFQFGEQTFDTLTEAREFIARFPDLAGMQYVRIRDGMTGEGYDA